MFWSKARRLAISDWTNTNISNFKFEISYFKEFGIAMDGMDGMDGMDDEGSLNDMCCGV